MIQSPIILSRRSPKDWKTQQEYPAISAGGVTNGIIPYITNYPTHPPLWICVSCGPCDKYKVDGNMRIHCEEKVGSRDIKYVMRKIFVPEDINKGHYIGACNGLDWPLYHIFYPEILKSKTFPNPECTGDDFLCYNMVNMTFANATMEELLRNDRPVWVHDYQLMRVPEKLRELERERIGSMKKSKIVFTLHIPVFDIGINEVRDIVKKYERIVISSIEGILCSDLITVHTPRWYNNLRKIIEEKEFFKDEVKITDDDNGYTVDYKGNITKVRAFPMGVDSQRIQEGMNDPGEFGNKEVMRAISEAEQKGAEIDVSISRNDYTKGNREWLLIEEKRMEDGEKLGLVGIFKKTREKCHGYSENDEELSKLSKRINLRFSRKFGFKPVSIFREGLVYPDIFKLPRGRNGAYPTIGDGLNICIPEWIIAQEGLPSEQRKRIYIGENCGASDVLEGITETDGVIRFDPLKPMESLEKIRKNKHRKITDHAIQETKKRLDVAKWGFDIFSDLYGDEIYAEA